MLVPLTGFLSLEGTSQRNGAELALREAAGSPKAASPAVEWNVSDTAPLSVTVYDAPSSATLGVSAGAEASRACSTWIM